ncbi:hypothetical protein LG52_3123 [Geobacillus kaustophilus]|uniref:Uncharacterized protein n=1 Tax=Geobacillus kaustophilus TaxID=1462 RepID=A0A0D8BPH2_GEOKU|nr:hypothetical protein LG52_3123 [Geobacillus kaustophilus]
MQNKKSRAKSVQNFFKFYRILSDSRKSKNDCKCSRIKGFTISYPNRSDVGNGDGGSRTHVQRHRHLSIYERSRYISLRRPFRLPTGLPAASLIRLFPHPQAADLGVARSI